MRWVSLVPPSVRLALFVGFAATLPLWMGRGDLFAYGIFTLLYVLLGLGLNVVVGYAGLLDLGYAAFFGFGAYFYALVSSEHYGIHWPALVSIPVVVVSTALLGLLLGIPSRRLLGDYLAIVTLFFGQAFVVFVLAANPTVAGKGLTGGPNGIVDIDPLTFFGYELTTRTQQFYFLLLAVTLVLVGLHFISESRTGRAWRALREDPLAAEAMSIPVNRLKLMAFSFGAGIAGLAGCIFAAVLTAVSPGNFALPLLITIYAIVILGGIGSLTGVVLGAIVINVSFQFLAPENPQDRARLLFYAVVLLLLALGLRSWWRLGAVLGGVVALGVVTQAIVEAVAPSWTGGPVVEGGRLGRCRRALGAHPVRARPVRGNRLRRARRRRPDAHAPARLGAARGARADPLPRRDRVGDQLRRAARGRALDPVRRAPGRPDERPPAGAARHAARGDRLMALFELKAVTKSFGGLHVVDGLSVAVEEGEIVSLIGPNGAGKTTVFNLVTGIYAPDEGEIRFAGQEIAGLPPHKITQLGIARTFQTLRLFLNMSVKENVMAAAYGHTKSTVFESVFRLPRARREEREIARFAEEKLAFFGQRLVGYRWDQPAYSLSYANRRRLEIARAMGANPPHAAARRAGRGHEPRRDARDDRADRPPAHRGVATRSS